MTPNVVDLTHHFLGWFGLLIVIGAAFVAFAYAMWGGDKK